MKNLKFMIWHLVLGILTIAGLYAFYLQETLGHQITGISKLVPWGVYIAAFTFFVGVSAGATIIGLLIYGFNKTSYKPIGARAILVGIVALLGAMLFIIMDVGMPLRALKIPWLLNNPSSLFFISSTSYYLFMVILLIELYFAVKVIKGNATTLDMKIAKWIGILAVPYALLVVHMVTGFIFSVIKTREYWNTSLLPLHFITSALASGTAVIILMALISSYTHKIKSLISDKALSFLGILLLNFIGVTLLFDLADVVVLMYSEHPEGIEAWRILTTEHLGIFAVNVGCLVLAFLLLLNQKWFGKFMIGLASVLVLISVAAYRYNLVIVPQKVPLLPGIDDISYTPTIYEVLICFGIIALIMLVYSIATKILPMEPEKATMPPEQIVSTEQDVSTYEPAHTNS